MTQVTPAKLSAAHAPVALTQVHTDPDGWLGRLQQRNAEETIPHIIAMLEAHGALANFRLSASGDRETRRQGGETSDADVYKTLEAIAWEIARSGTDRFDTFLDETISLISSAQRPDGYLNTWSEVGGEWHDLVYEMELAAGGHLIQAAIALNRIGRPALLEVARRWADLVVERFGPEKEGFGGHVGVEDALVELYRETGEKNYLDTALALVERRGHQTMPTDRYPSSYFQDHEPVREATEALGQVVRALCLDAACVDLAVETGDPSLWTAAEKRWESAHHTKMYITGGLGSRHFDESYGAPYELPASRAYCATSAAVADVLGSWRMLLVSGEARYADVIERLIHNALPAAMSEDGRAFFRSNPLQIRTMQRNEDHSRIQRAPWLPSGPTNLARLIASLGAYVATTQGMTLYIQQWTPCTIDLPEQMGTGKIIVETTFPADGHIRIRLEGQVNPGAKIRLRLPSWCENMTIDGRSALVVDGYVSQQLSPGFDISMVMPMEPRFVAPHPRIDAVRGCRALLRGPVVYCAEQVDIRELESRVFVPVAIMDQPQGSELPTIKVTTQLRRQTASLYSRSIVNPDEATEWSELHPYYSWGNRRPAPMRVWLPVI